MNTTYEHGFVDLPNTHSIYTHSPSSGHFISIGARGETIIMIKMSHLILDSVVAPFDKIDVSRQLFKTIWLSFRNVHGNVINLHGANISFSWNLYLLVNYQ